MPEPVVIYGPAGGPHGPIPGQPDAANSDSPASDPAEGGETIIPPRRGLRIARTILTIMGKVAWAITAAILHVIRRNPRHSIAAAASLAILGGIYYSQTRSGTTRRDVTNAIRSNQSQTEGKPKDPNAPKPDPVVAAATKSETSDQEKNAAAPAPSPPKSEQVGPAIAQADAAAKPNPPAPKSDTTHDSALPVGSLAKADTPDNHADHLQPAPAPGPAAADAPVTPLPAPGGDLAKATLIEAPATNTPVGPAPAPVSSLPKDEKPAVAEIGAASQTGTVGPVLPPGSTASTPVGAQTKSDVPDDLFLPEPATKSGSEESKPVQANVSVLTPAPSGPAQPPENPKKEDPKKGDVPDPKPGEPAVKSAADSIVGLAPVPVVTAPVVPVPKDEKPLAVPEEKSGPPASVIEAPAVVPGSLERAVSEPAPDRSTRAPAEMPHGAGTPALPAAAAAAAIGGERAAESGGDGKPASPAAEGPKSPSTAIAATQPEIKREASAPRDVNDAGWISIPNSGVVPRDPTDVPAHAGAEADPAMGSALASRADDARAHAGRAVDFEPEPSQSQNHEPAASESTSGSRRLPGGAARDPQPRAASHSERVEATDHLVERDENYWTISRQYYNSGRYYRALWKANSAKYPDIKVLHVNDVIVIPAVEDLDPEYILPASTRAPSRSRAASADPSGRGQGSRGDDEPDASVTGSSSRSPGSLSSGRVSLATRSTEAVSRRGDPDVADLDPPASGRSAGHDRVAPLKGRSRAASGIFDGNGDEPETRDAARPRSTDGATTGRPVYRVRSYDTLRSIARDTLGDSRRADEILELNRGLIDNPTQLVAGQLLELPDDARTAIRRPVSRR